MNRTEQLFSTLPGDVFKGLRRADQLWDTYRQGDRPIPSIVHPSSEALPHEALPHKPQNTDTEWDVIICGGTLGIMLGAALVQREWRVAVIERGPLKGREQEWNISRKELTVLTDLGLLTVEELEGAIASEYNPARLAFHKGPELWVEDVLNIGVDPVVLIETLKTKFLAGGGHLLEHTAFESATIHPNGVNVHIKSALAEPQKSSTLSARLMIDAMGHFSPIANQARKGRTPNAVCMVVGTCAQGFSNNETGDLFASFTPLEDQRQYFWEAFPARDGRTTYMFTYVDAHPKRPRLEDLFEDYWRLLPDYQGKNPEDLQLVRALFGFFPCYRDSPLQLPWDRMLAVGDSSGNQSPLSFGGFGAMLRHLSRLTEGMHDALECDRLSQSDLALLQPYQPNLSVTWLFQRSMSVAIEQGIPPNQINELLSAVFEQMDALGMPVLKPFLQDVVQLSGLFQSLIRTTIFHPIVTLKVLPQVGIIPLLDWMVHYANLAGYTGLSAIAPIIQSWSKSLGRSQQYTIQRWIDAWYYGAGLDHIE